MKRYLEGIKDGIPIGLGYLSVSFTFGIAAVAPTGGGQALSVWQALLISMTNLTSAGQVAGLQIMLSGGTLLEMAISEFIINLRYSLMSISLSQKVNKKFKGIFRWLLGFGITDEIYAVAVLHKGAVGRSYFLGLMTVPYIGWSLGTLLGALSGNLLPAIICSALGLAIYGMFIAIIVPPMKKSRSTLLVVCIAVILSCLFTYVPGLNKVSVGFSIIICAVVASNKISYSCGIQGLQRCGRREDVPHNAHHIQRYDESL